MKIGYQVVLKLLRAGATVIVTTRFPHAAACRFAGEPDAGNWTNRLVVYGLDLRLLPAVETFASVLAASQPHLDIFIHNAAQTVRRPPGFYRHLLAREHSNPARCSPPLVRAACSAVPCLCPLSNSPPQRPRHLAGAGPGGLELGGPVPGLPAARGQHRRLQCLSAPVFSSAGRPTSRSPFQEQLGPGNPGHFPNRTP